MSDGWDAKDAGIMALPSGRLVRGRGLRHALPPGAAPDFALHLLSHRPKPVPWPSHWLRWPDFRLPADDREAREAIADLWTRAERQRVDIACGGGRGRTRTVLACLAVLDGVPPRAAVACVRRHYGERAVETPESTPLRRTIRQHVLAWR